MPNAIAGRDATILFKHRDASHWLNEYEIEREADDIEVTRFGARDKEYLSGPRENTVTLSGHWTGEDDGFDELIDETFGTAGDQIVTICPGGAILGNSCYLTPAIQTSDDLSAEADDLTEDEWEFRASTVRRGKVLQGLDVAVTATGEGDEVIAKATTNLGASAHLHVLEVDGGPTGVAIVVEQSDDGTTWAPLFTFGAVTEPTSERLVTSATAEIKKQLRVKHTITGGTSPRLVYVCAVGRHTYR